MTSTAAPPEQAKIRRLANAIRMLSIDAVEKAKSGHPGLPMGMADAATVLFSRFLKFDPANPHWPDRDRFVLSAGHGSMLLYSLLYLTGYPDMTMDQLEHFRQVGSRTAGHPEYGHAPGHRDHHRPARPGHRQCRGHGDRRSAICSARFGKELVDHKTYVIASDGDLEEGISHEAISLAGHLKLNKLIVLWDHNNITIDGATSLSESTDMIERFKAAGWTTDSCNGHDAADVFRALSAAQNSDAPVMIACRTIIGFGMPHRQGTQKAHSDAPGAEEVAATRKELGWDYPAFRGAGRSLQPVARHRRAGQSRPGTSWVKRKNAHRPRPRNSTPRMADAIPAEVRPGPGRAERKDERGKARRRHPQTFGKGAGSHQRRARPSPSAARPI